MLPPIYEQNDATRVLLNFDPLTEEILEARRYKDGRWLPWVLKNGELDKTQTCVRSDGPGSVIHFNVFPDGTMMFNVRMPDGTTAHHVKQATPPTKFGCDIEFVLRHLAGREVIHGPEVRRVDDLPLQFQLVTTTSDDSTISVLDVLRSKADDTAAPTITERFSFDLNAVGVSPAGDLL